MKTYQQTTLRAPLRILQKTFLFFFSVFFALSFQATALDLKSKPDILNLPQVDLTSFQFVFVAGLGNEEQPDYFVAAGNFLQAQGIPTNHISQIMPSSNNTVSENVPIVHQALLNLYTTNQRPLYVVAHSKGGLEVANALGQYASDFPPNVLAKVIFANTPFQGSPYTAQSIKEFQQQWDPWGTNFTPEYLNALNVMKSLNTDVIQSDLQKSFSETSADNLASLSQRLFYLRTKQSADKVNSALQESANFLVSYGPNDGVIPVDNQKLVAFQGLPQFGNDLLASGVLPNTDHMALFVVAAQPPDTQQSQAFSQIFGIASGQ